MAKFEISGIKGDYSNTFVEAETLRVAGNGTVATLESAIGEIVAVIVLAEGVKVIRTDDKIAP